MHNPKTYLDSICPQDPKKEATVAKKKHPGVNETLTNTLAQGYRDLFAQLFPENPISRDSLLHQLTEFSTWLDADEKLMKKPKKKDKRTHEDLAKQFLHRAGA